MDYILQLNFYNYLNYFDYTNLLCCSKNYYYNKYYNCDNIYREYLIKKFSNNFVEIVKPIIICYYDCFLRIIIFENTISKMGYELWNEDIYYLFWKCKYDLILNS